MSSNTLPVFPSDLLIKLCGKITPPNLVLQQVSRMEISNRKLQSRLVVVLAFHPPFSLQFIKNVFRNAPSP
ncbi:unnamed protein product [Schistosoma mattheei]|uniref:Uncharacterized protein n=1 Tax=Schistosoma mattheei TaxID=31246 RepID=A0A183PCM5_9TREM|nr:unnamed protein product [Schistosoma mattheei]